MTDATLQAELRKERARQDLSDIATLRKTEAFDRYWMRRLTQKKSELAQKILYDEMSAEKREALRYGLVALDEVEKMLKTDESSARRELV